MRFAPGGVAELMLSSSRTHLVSLALDDAGLPHVGTGAEGRVFTVDDNHVEQLVVDTDERQVGALSMSGKTRFVATSDPVVFHRVTGKGGADAVWTSHVMDAGLRAHFGLLKWTAEGALELQTRSGNTAEPDKTWSAWSASLAKPAKIKSPAARYVQIRAKWSRDAAAVLREVDLAFVTDNARALLTEVTAGSKSGETGSSRVPSSGTAPGSPSAKIKLSWRVDNPDRDKLRFRLLYRSDAGKQHPWVAILDSDTAHTKTSYSWDTAGLPEGRYRLRVDASDELANPPSRVTRHSLTSSAFVIDNTAPQLTKLNLQGTRLRGTAVDGIGPIVRVEVQRMGSKNFIPVFPTDQVFDERTESFDVDVSSILPPGRQLLVVRAYDSAGNRVSRTVSR